MKYNFVALICNGFASSKSTPDLIIWASRWVYTLLSCITECNCTVRGEGYDPICDATSGECGCLLGLDITQDCNTCLPQFYGKFLLGMLEQYVDSCLMKGNQRMRQGYLSNFIVNLNHCRSSTIWEGLTCNRQLAWITQTNAVNLHSPGISLNILLLLRLQVVYHVIVTLTVLLTVVTLVTMWQDNVIVSVMCQVVIALCVSRASMVKLLNRVLVRYNLISITD